MAHDIKDYIVPAEPPKMTMIRCLDKRQNKPDLRQYTMDDIADAIVEQVDTMDMCDEKKAETREHLLAVFKTVANIK